MAGSGRGAWIPHAVLLAGLALVLFPIYVAFAASSLTLPDILDAPMTLVPGPHLLANYREALTTGTLGTSGQGVGRMMANSLVMALAIADRQDRDLAALGLCGRVLPLSAAARVLLGDLCHLDAAGRGQDRADLQDRRRPRPH